MIRHSVARVVALTLLAATPVVVGAQSTAVKRDNTGYGTTAAEFLLIGANARGMALGGGYLPVEGMMSQRTGSAAPGFGNAQAQAFGFSRYWDNLDQSRRTSASPFGFSGSAEDGTGTLVGNLANKTDEPIALMSVKGVPGNTTVTSSEFAPITVPGRAGVPLAGGAGGRGTH